MDIRPAGLADIPAIERLLRADHLPTVGIREGSVALFVAADGGDVIGVIGLEVRGRSGLLRSAAVAADRRGEGLGARLVATILDEAKRRELDALCLLTTTAERYFPRFGFARTTREAIPVLLRDTDEVAHACPGSAVVMVRAIDPMMP